MNNIWIKSYSYIRGHYPIKKTSPFPERFFSINNNDFLSFDHAQCFGHIALAYNDVIYT